MKTTGMLSIGLVVVLSVGCTTSFRPWLLSDIHENMNRDEVIRILGNPDNTVNSGATNYLYYSYTENLAPVGFDFSVEDDFSKQAERFSHSFREYTYEIRLVNGMVAGYREVTP